MDIIKQIKKRLRERIKFHEQMLKTEDSRPSDIGRIEEAKYVIRLIDYLMKNKTKDNTEK